MSKYLDTLLSEIDQDALDSIRSIKLSVMKIISNPKQKPETVDLAKMALINIKKIEQDYLDNMAK